eukprot:390861-Pyramimonas_sp.AAC.1
MRHCLSPAQCDIVCVASPVRHFRTPAKRDTFYLQSSATFVVVPAQYDMCCTPGPYDVFRPQLLAAFPA